MFKIQINRIIAIFKVLFLQFLPMALLLIETLTRIQFVPIKDSFVQYNFDSKIRRNIANAE